MLVQSSRFDRRRERPTVLLPSKGSGAERLLLVRSGGRLQAGLLATSWECGTVPGGWASFVSKAMSHKSQIVPKGHTELVPGLLSLPRMV